MKYSVKFAIFENVPGIKDNKNAHVFSKILKKLQVLEFWEDVTECYALDFGGPQTRRRMVISAFKSKATCIVFLPKKLERRNLTARNAIYDSAKASVLSKRLNRGRNSISP